MLLFPCNQFGAQEPGSDKDVLTFCTVTKGVKGATVFSKGDVNGEDTRPTYKVLREAGVVPPSIKWNFSGKFIVNRSGEMLPVNNTKVVSDIRAMAKGAAL